MILFSVSIATSCFLFLADIQTQLMQFLSFSKNKHVNKHSSFPLFANLTLPGGVQGNVVAGTVLVLWTVPWK